MTRKSLLAATFSSLLCSLFFGSAIYAEEDVQAPSITDADREQFRQFAQMKAFHAQMRANMRTVQIAVESYATDSPMVYPKSVKDASPYLPGGSNKIGGKPGLFPTNPVTGVANEIPFTAPINSSAQIAKMIKLPPQYTTGKAGQIGYSVFNNNKSYVIVGTDMNGNAIPEKDGTYMILSNETLK